LSPAIPNPAAQPTPNFEGVKSTDLKMLVDVLAQIRSRRAELF
jgi:hypothetical protein